MTPRPFQSRALTTVGDKLRDGAMAALLVAPTGSGKTVMAAMMIAALVASGKRVAFGAHREELLLQAARTLRSFGLEIGFQGLGKSAPVQLGSYQTWAARDEAPECDYFFADEAHHLGDRVGWQRISGAYRAAGKRMVGLTATPARGDGLALPDFDALVVAAQIAELQALGLLVPLRWRGPGAAIARQRIAREPWVAYREECPGRTAVCFSSNRNAAEAHVAGFRADGWTCEMVMGSTEPELRARYLQQHDAGELQVLVNVAVLGEGWDNPRCDCVIVPRGCGSIVSWIQWAGRGLRPFPGKEDCFLLDLAGVAHTLGRPDAETTYSLEGAGIIIAPESCPAGERLCKVFRRPLPESLICDECFKDHNPKPPKAIGAPLTDWQTKWNAAREGVKPGPLVLSLAGLMVKARNAAMAGKPWKDTTIATRFLYTFRRRPYESEMAAARNFLRAAERFEVERTEAT